MCTDEFNRFVYESIEDLLDGQVHYHDSIYSKITYINYYNALYLAIEAHKDQNYHHVSQPAINVTLTKFLYKSRNSVISDFICSSTSYRELENYQDDYNKFMVRKKEHSNQKKQYYNRVKVLVKKLEMKEDVSNFNIPVNPKNVSKRYYDESKIKSLEESLDNFNNYFDNGFIFGVKGKLISKLGKLYDNYKKNHDLIKKYNFQNKLYRIVTEILAVANESNGYVLTQDDISSTKYENYDVISILHDLLFPKEKDLYQVAVCIKGTRNITLKDKGSKDNRFSIVYSDKIIKWPYENKNSSKSTKDNLDLMTFCLGKWDLNVSKIDSDLQKIKSCICIFKVDAYNFVQAKQYALEKAEILASLIRSNERVSTVYVDDDVIVKMCNKNGVRHVGENSAYMAESYYWGPQENVKNIFQNSLKFYDRAMSEHNTSASCMFMWFALESLGYGYTRGKTQNFIANKCPNVVALSSLSSLIDSSMHVFYRKFPDSSIPTRIYNFLNFPQKRFLMSDSKKSENGKKQNLFHALMINVDPINYGEFYRKYGFEGNYAREVQNEFEKEFIKNLSLYESYKIEKTRNILKNPNDLHAYLDTIKSSASDIISLLRISRNISAHSGKLDVAGYSSLTVSAQQILFHVYSSFKTWNKMPWEIIDSLDERYIKFKDAIHNIDKQKMNTPSFLCYQIVHANYKILNELDKY